MKRGGILCAAIAACSFGMVGCATTPTGSTQSLKQVSAPPTGCKALGEVQGYHNVYGDPGPSATVARSDAFAKAEKLGATHVQVIREARTENWELSCWVMAYHCPASVL